MSIMKTSNSSIYNYENRHPLAMETLVTLEALKITQEPSNDITRNLSQDKIIVQN